MSWVLGRMPHLAIRSRSSRAALALGQGLGVEDAILVAQQVREHAVLVVAQTNVDGTDGHRAGGRVQDSLTDAAVLALAGLTMAAAIQQFAPWCSRGCRQHGRGCCASG